jgi:alkylation response protein AidB-like acyl-CoA dehydrogenase
MDFALTPTQTELKAAARRYLSDRYPVSRIAELADAGEHDLEAWPELTRQGWLDPDLGLVELASLAEEGGRALHPVPWWTTVGSALPVYRAAGVELPGPATLADGSDTCQATPHGADWLLDGRVAAVIDAGTAAEIVVAARTGSGVALFGVRPDGAGVSLAAGTGIDPLRESAALELAGARGRLLVGASATVAPLLAAGHRRAVMLLTAEAAGVAGRALDIAAGYATTRVQFDRPIGSFQAVGHALAEGYAELELARSLAYRAACVLEDGGDNPDEALACAVHAGRRAAVVVCETAIQVCGGLGVTWEFGLHRWYRRALWLDAYHAGRPDPLILLAEVVLGKEKTSCR